MTVGWVKRPKLFRISAWWVNKIEKNWSHLARHILYIYIAHKTYKVPSSVKIKPEKERDMGMGTANQRNWGAASRTRITFIPMDVYLYITVVSPIRNNNRCMHHAMRGQCKQAKVELELMGSRRNGRKANARWLARETASIACRRQI